MPLGFAQHLRTNDLRRDWFSFETCPLVDREMEKKTAARILTKFVVYVAEGETNYDPKFQISCSNNLGNMPFFWLKLRIKKGTLFIIFLMKTYLLLKLPKSRERVKQNFLSLKKFIENQFFEVVLSRHKKRFRVDWAILIFYENFSEIVNLDFEFFLCRNSGLKKFFKNL